MSRLETVPSVRGYVPGVFDMFHVGHLNIVRQARTHCDSLIVGVVADDVVTRIKGRPPVVPLDERIEIVAALRDVDEVVVDEHADKFDAWRELHYDVIFKGDDWRGTPKGLKLEHDLAAVGARLVYFPYTRHTSSTILRAALDGMVDPTTWPPEWTAVRALAAEAEDAEPTALLTREAAS